MQNFTLSLLPHEHCKHWDLSHFKMNVGVHHFCSDLKLISIFFADFKQMKTSVVCSPSFDPPILRDRASGVTGLYFSKPTWIVSEFLSDLSCGVETQ